MGDFEKKEDIHEDIQEIKEFKVTSDAHRGARKKAEMGSLGTIADWSGEKKAVLMMGVFSAIGLLFLVLSIWLLKLHPVVACLVLVIQAVIGVLLDQNPIWVHALVVIADLVVGFVLAIPVFMIMSAVIYVAAISSLEVWQRLSK